MALNEHNLLCNDTVFKFDKNGRIKFGLVADIHDDLDDLDESEYGSYLDYSVQLRDEEISVAWYPDGHDEVIEKQKVQLAYRAINPNDVVRRITPGSDSQRGYCIESHLSADVQINGKSVVIKNVANSRLHSLIEEGDWVEFDSCIGRAKKIQLKLLLKTLCGALVETLASKNDYKFHDPDEKHRNHIFPSNKFYPGQKLVGSTKSFLNEKWITPKPSFRNNYQRIKFVVQSVKVDGVWIKRQLNIDRESEKDSKYVTGDDLKRLKQFCPYQKCCRQIGDMNLLKVTQDDLLNAVSKTQWRKQRSRDYKNQKIYDSDNGWQTDDDGWQTDDDGWQIDDDDWRTEISLNQLKQIKKSAIKNPPKIGDEISVEIIMIRSKVTVVWEDGTIESGISSTHLYTIELDENEYFPGNYVVVESKIKDSSNRNYGIVQKVDRNERTAMVKWFRTYALSDTSDISEPQFINETEASFYDLKFHRDFNFELHSNVTRFVNDHDENDKITIGHVIHIGTDGSVKVQWIDGNYSMCWPQDLVVISESRYNSMSSLNSTQNDEWEIETEPNLEIQIESHCNSLSKNLRDAYKAAASMETSMENCSGDIEMVIQKMLEIKKKCSFIDRLMNTSFFDFELITSNIMKPTKSIISNSAEPNSVENTVSEELLEKSYSTTNQQDLNKSYDAVNDSKNNGDFCLKLSDVASFSSRLRENLRKALDEMSKRIQISVSKPVDELDLSKKLKVTEDKIHSSEDVTTVTDANKITTNTAITNPLPSECFVVLESAPTTHKFKSTMVNPSDLKQFHRAVKDEHKILLTSLPPGVWVKAYEDRMDLLSVAIIGPKGTPYEDGIFLFDFQLVKNYPKSPPLCHYVSFCSKVLNPNLYVNGKVCTSLLGTWSGEGSENWGPGCTLLQVIVSIQGLILNSEPYFNEAGFDKQKGTQEGHKESEIYNELVVIRLVESMTKLIANPPKVFRDEIIKHFQTRGDSMYERITGWMDKSKETEFSLVPSRGFRLKLVDLLVHFRNNLDAINREC